MSGSIYNAGSNAPVAVQVAMGASGRPDFPLNVANNGTGTVTNIQAMMASAQPYTGVFTIRFTNNATGDFTITGYHFATSPPPAASLTTTTRTAPPGGVPTLITVGSLNLKFTITNNGTLSVYGPGSGAFQPGDGFLLFVSQDGQNTMTTAVQSTGSTVVLQQFQTFSTAPSLYWGAAINAMFVYCGNNPGVVGIIPPGFYDCSDVASLNIQSNMTISAYGAIIFTSQNAAGDYGFLTVDSALGTAAAVASGTGLHDITIRGGTWGGAGLNGALCTDSSASVLYQGARTGKVISLFVDHDLTLIDVTVRGWKAGLAFYLFCNNNLTLDNCSFWNSDGKKGSGGVRIANGNNMNATNTNGISGDDCLQFAPSGSATAQMGTGISNAFFIGGNVQSLAARAFVVTLIAGGTMPDTTYVMTSTIAHVGFIGIVGNVSAASALACYISNKNSVTASVTLPPSSMPMPQPPAVVPPSLQDVTVAGCKLIAPTGALNTAMIEIECGAPFTVTNMDMSTTTNYCGPVQDIYFSDTSTTNAAKVAVSLSGYYSTTSPGSSTYITLQNVNFRACTFYEPLGTTATGTVEVFNCVGYGFDTCSIYSNNAPCFMLGSLATMTAAGNIASLGRISGCMLYTYSTTAPSQMPLIVLANGDMNAITGWSRFFLGNFPVIGTPTGNAQSGVDILASVPGTYTSAVTNTFVDCVDFRGLPTGFPISDNGQNTRAGLNILTSPLQQTGALILAKARNNLSSGATYIWPNFTTMVVLTATTATSGVTINLPAATNDGEVHILSAPNATYSTITFVPPVKGFSPTTSTIGPSTPLTIAWDAAGMFWFQA